MNNNKRNHYLKTKKGLTAIIYAEQRRRSKDKGYPEPSYNLYQIREWIYKQDNWDYLFNNWINTGYNTNLRPSINRIDPYKGYSFSNIELMTWDENRKIYYKNKLNGINNKTNKPISQYNLQGENIKEYYSIGQASRITGLDQANIIHCLKGRYKKCGGFIWKYK